MTRFTHLSLDADGRQCSGTVVADDARQAAAQLRHAGLFPLQLKAEDSQRTGLAAGGGVRLHRLGRWLSLHSISAKELALFTRQLATLLRAGMPLLRGLQVLGRQQRNAAFGEIIAALTRTIQAGGTLSEGMAEYPRVFDRLAVNMVRAGEAGGALDTVLDRVARFQEKSVRLRGRLRAALVYPLVVLVVAMAILAGLLVFVVPRFRQIFADLLKGAPLPGLTRGVLAVSEAVVHSLPALLLGGLVLAVVGRLFARSATGARWVDGTLLRLPVVGQLVIQAIAVRFSRTLGTLLASGVPILPALLITRETCGNLRVAAALTAVHDRVKAGGAVAPTLEATGVFPPMVTSLIDVGEETGGLPDMLGKVAEIYEEEVDNAVAGLTSLIEPALILFLAVVVGTIVIALFLPIVRIVQLMT